MDPGGDGVNYAQAYRARVVNFVGQNYDAYVGDTFSSGRLTVNGGVRWDRQTAANDASTAPANTAFPDLLPALTFNGGGTTISWNDISPTVIEGSLRLEADVGFHTCSRGHRVRGGQVAPAVRFERRDPQPNRLGDARALGREAVQIDTLGVTGSSPVAPTQGDICLPWECRMSPFLCLRPLSPNDEAHLPRRLARR